MVATTLPSGARSTAASSPIPTSWAAPGGASAWILAMSPNSPRSATVMVVLPPQSPGQYRPGCPADGGSYGSVAPTLGAQEDGMVQAYILVQTEVGKAAEVAVQIGQITGVTQADDVTGPYDVIVRAEADNVDDLGKLVVAQIQGVQGITRTLTCPIVHI
jgi:DNA-binding Lrp family transcriptional regulator